MMERQTGSHEEGIGEQVREAVFKIAQAEGMRASGNGVGRE